MCVNSIPFMNIILLILLRGPCEISTLWEPVKDGNVCGIYSCLYIICFAILTLGNFVDSNTGEKVTVCFVSGLAVGIHFLDECGIPKPLEGLSNRAEVRKHPWQIALYTKFDRYLCGGSVITTRHILTAAHCVSGYNCNGWYAMLGMINQIFRDGSKYNFKDILVHPLYYFKTFPVNDVSIAVTIKKIEFDWRVWPVCLETAPVNLYHQEGIISGWGAKGYKDVRFIKLSEGKVRILDPVECKEEKITGADFDETKMLCAVANGVDACEGHSGGPLVIQNKFGAAVQVGIVSYGYKCATNDGAGIYTKISSYLEWIRNITDHTPQCRVQQ